MPYKAIERDGGWVVINTETDEVKAKHTDKASAERQVRLLDAIEHDPEFDKG
jgi:hypothetical protein